MFHFFTTPCVRIDWWSLLLRMYSEVRAIGSQAESKNDAANGYKNNNNNHTAHTRNRIYVALLKRTKQISCELMFVPMYQSYAGCFDPHTLVQPTNLCTNTRSPLIFIRRLLLDRFRFLSLERCLSPVLPNIDCSKCSQFEWWVNSLFIVIDESPLLICVQTDFSRSFWANSTLITLNLLELRLSSIHYYLHSLRDWYHVAMRLCTFNRFARHARADKRDIFIQLVPVFSVYPLE